MREGSLAFLKELVYKNIRFDVSFFSLIKRIKGLVLTVTLQFIGFINLNNEY